jgi:hypothetical protein
MARISALPVLHDIGAFLPTRNPLTRKEYLR